MTISDTFKIAVEGLYTNKSRSLLTVLGIVIGITSIILMMSIGQGAEALIIGEISGLGAETIVIRPGKEPTGPSDLGETLFADSLTAKDIAALQRKSNVPHLIGLTPALIVPGGVSYEGETFSPSILGISGEFFADAFNVYPSSGVLYTEGDIRQNASVAVIGTRVVEKLFSTSDPLGEYIKIKDRKFRVIGVFPKKGQVAFFNIDQLVIIPYTTA